MDSRVEINFAFKHKVMQLIKQESEVSENVMPRLFLKREDDPIHAYPANTTPEGKRAWMGVIAPTLIRMRQAEMFCFVASAWAVGVDHDTDLSDVGPVSKRDDRFELIIASFGNKHGRVETWINQHSRDNSGNIVLADWQYDMETSDSITQALLDAVVEMA